MESPTLDYVDSQKDLAKEILTRYEELKSLRSTWESVWQEIREFVRPNGEDFQGSLTPGSTRNDRVYDDTPSHALDQFASGLQAFVSNPGARWMELATDNYELDRNPEVAAWLESVSDLIYETTRDADSQHAQMMHELYMELGSWGTAIMHVFKDVDTRELRFRTYPLSQCFIDENDDGVVDTVYRKICWNTKQAIQYFGEATPDKILKEKQMSRKWEFVHAVEPRNWRNPEAYDAKNMAWRSAWVSVECKSVIKESGFKQFPYMVPRWNKLAGEVYGRSPAMLCLQNIRVLNAATKVMLMSSQLQAAPPLLVEDENVVGGIKLQPYSLIYTSPGAENAVRPLQTGSNLAVNLDLIARLQKMIKDCFHNDLFAMPDTGNRDRVTATEINENRDDRLRRMAPALGRLEAELLNPQIRLVYNHLLEDNRLPSFPRRADGSKMRINYISPAALAQRGVKAMNMQRFMADIIPLTQVYPDVLKAINFDVAVQDYAALRNVSRRAMRTLEEVEQMKAGEAQQQQMMQLAQAAPQMASAMKDIAQAGEIAPNLGAAFNL